MVLTESWLHEGILDSLLKLDGYMLVHRYIESGKKSGKGVCMYICDRWCKQYTVRDKLCTPDIELYHSDLIIFRESSVVSSYVQCISHQVAMQVKLQRASLSVHMCSFSPHLEALFSFWAILINAS